MPYSTNVAQGSCDLLNQDCEPGKTCYPLLSSGHWTTGCFVTNGLKSQGSNCVSNVECQAGLRCLLNRCAPFCCPDGQDLPCGGGACDFRLQLGPDVDGKMADVSFCSYGEKCSLFDPNSCPPKVGEQPTYCQVSDPKTGLITCQPTPSGMPLAEGEMCKSANECGANAACRTGTCRYLCDEIGWKNKQPGLGGCPMAQTCNKVNVGVMNVGICGP